MTPTGHDEFSPENVPEEPLAVVDPVREVVDAGELTIRPAPALGCLEVE